MTNWYYQRFQPGAKTVPDEKKAENRERDGFMDAQRAALGLPQTGGKHDEQRTFGTNWKAGK
mgnify:CR=1 FL=1